MSYHPTDEPGEPPEWRGRGRPDWPTMGGGPYRASAPVGHRDTGELRRIRAEQAREADRERAEQRAAEDRLYANNIPAVQPQIVLERDPAERLDLWLGICQKVFAILALLVVLYFGGFALVHGGWPVWIPIKP